MSDFSYRFAQKSLFFSLFFVFLSLSQPLFAKVFSPETFTLDNGLQVVIVTNRRVPLVTQMVWYKVGAVDEPAGKSGIAHFLEHLMFKGTDKLKPGEFSRMIAQQGGQDNAATTWDHTHYYEIVSRDNLETAIRMEADRMAHLRLSDEVVKPELQVVLEERRQRTENQPDARLQEAMQTALFVHHPYGIPIIGWENEIEQLTRSDAESFYKTWYTPNNAIVVFSGDVNADEIRPLVEKYYSPLKSHPLPPRVVFPSPSVALEKRLTLRDPLVGEPQWLRSYLAPSYRTDTGITPYALEVLSEIMGGGTTSRLYRNIVVKQKLAVSAGTSYSPMNRDLSSFMLYAEPASGISIEKLEAAVMEQISLLLKKGVTAKEVSDAKTRLKRRAIFARDSATGPAEVLGSALAIGLKVQDVEEWPDRIGSVTEADVLSASQKIFGVPGSITGILLPPKAKNSGQGEK